MKSEKETNRQIEVEDSTIISVHLNSKPALHGYEDKGECQMKAVTSL